MPILMLQFLRQSVTGRIHYANFRSFYGVRAVCSKSKSFCAYFCDVIMFASLTLWRSLCFLALANGLATTGVVCEEVLRQGR